MRITIAYLSCGCVIWLPPGAGTMIAANDRCIRCGYAGSDTIIRETRVIKEPAS